MALPPPRPKVGGPPPRPKLIGTAVPEESADQFIERVTKLHEKSDSIAQTQDLFTIAGDEENLHRVYTTKILAPVYKPRGRSPDIRALVDTSKARMLADEIDQSNLSSEEKRFLIIAASRHNVFNYEDIADYYANASAEMQRFMERSALVIIDFEDALKLGFVRYTKEIADLYRKEHEGD